MSFEADVYGAPPVPKGAMRCNRGKPYWANSKRLKDWRRMLYDEIHDAASVHYGKGMPVAVELGFYFPKPKRGAPRHGWHVVRPDLDKLARAVLDELTGIVIYDDSQVASLTCTKSYVDSLDFAGVKIKVEPL